MRETPRASLALPCHARQLSRETAGGKAQWAIGRKMATEASVAETATNTKTEQKN